MEIILCNKRMASDETEILRNLDRDNIVKFYEWLESKVKLEHTVVKASVKNAS